MYRKQRRRRLSYASRIGGAPEQGDDIQGSTNASVCQLRPPGDGVRSLPHLGAELLSLALQTDPHDALKRSSRSILEWVRDQTEETAALVVRNFDERLTIDVLLSPHELRASPAVGSRKPIHTGAAGKTLLAYVDESELDALAARTGLPRLTTTTLTSVAKLKRQLALVRARGYATSISEAVMGQGAVAVPVILGGRPVAAINICAPTLRLNRKQVQLMVEIAMVAASRLADTLLVHSALSPEKGRMEVRAKCKQESKAKRALVRQSV